MPVPVSPTKMNASDPKRIGGVWSFIARFNAMIDWLASLSPSGATQYDTGWVNLTLNPAFDVQGVNTPEIRRIGTKVEMRGLIKASTGNLPTGNTNLLTLPAGTDPGSGWLYRAGAGQNIGVNYRVVIQSGGIVQVAASGASEWMDIGQSWELG